MNENICLATMLFLTSSKNVFLFFYPILMFFLSYFFNIKEYKFYNKEKVNSIIQNIKHNFAFKFDENNKPIGLVIHKNTSWYIPCYACWISECDYDKTVLVFANETTRKKLLSVQSTDTTSILSTSTNDKVDEDDEDEDKHKCSIDYFIQYGHYRFIRYTSRAVTIQQEFTAKQKAISETIISTYQKQNRVSCYIHGDIGTGKTMLCYILAKQLNASICDTFTPSKPGSYLEDLYTHISPTQKKPFILLLDEIDIMLDNIHNQTILPHKDVSIQIYDKPSWNRFFDSIHRGMFPHLIVILCSNSSDTHINKKYESSYLREGRIHHTFTL